MGFRGYVSSRPFFGERVPQHVQNLVIRDYCIQHGVTYLLSATEVVMPDSYLMLNKLLEDLGGVDGIVCYSLFQLPEDEIFRRHVFEKILAVRKSIHFAVETLRAENIEQVVKLNDIFRLKKRIGDALNKKDLEVWLNKAI